MKRNLPRRKFLKSIGGTTAALAFPNAVEIAAGESFQTQKRARVAVFWEAEFPSINGCAVTREALQQALADFEVSYLSEQALIERLGSERFDLLITPYGSAFPKRAWRAVLNYLQAGGNLMNLGGVPFAVPVIQAGGQWRGESPQTAFHKRLGITQSFPVTTTGIVSYDSSRSGKGFANLGKEFQAREVYEFYVRFTSTNYYPEESGSDGPREAALHPLVFGINQQGRRIAAPVIQIDRLQGDFAGGRWVLANFTGSISSSAIRMLAERASQGAIQFIVRSVFACYRDRETPSFTVQVHRPRGDLDKIICEGCRIEVTNALNQLVSRLPVILKGEGTLTTVSVRLPDEIKLTPGFYTVQSRMSYESMTDSSLQEITYATGFWVYDHSVMTRGRPFNVDDRFFHRDGQVFPVLGTTYMASDVHRQFLFDPNPFIWEQDFKEMKAAGINMVRTGIWTGWKKYMPQVGKVNEVALRALDAFLLTAHSHDIPVIFTFFAFLPEPWGGENCYLDPQAVEAQSKFVSTFADRYREVDDLIWDLINEPSFGSLKHIWSCRPNYDKHEKAAWQEWLSKRYPHPNEEARAGALQQLWRTTSEDSLDLPRLEDFESRHIFDARFPIKTLDYRLFAQEMFIRWARAMIKAIRNNGNQSQLITVGQDENGLGDSPNPQFFAGLISFASLHNWWNNDDLVWDSVLAKVFGKANLVEETGIMFYEKSDGSAWRTEEEARNLLERKMAICFGADGAGFIEWIWNANCYINSDNEAAIGFHRADYTAKPELEPFLTISKFYSTHRSLLHAAEHPQVQMLIPHSQMFSPRNFATEATRRSVRAMYYHCRMPLSAVGEYLFALTGANAKLVVVPSPRVLSQKCWDALVRSVESGATAIISGIFDADEHWLPVERSQRFGWSAHAEPVSESEFISIAGRQYLLRYEGEKIQRIEKAVVRRTGLEVDRSRARRDNQVQVLVQSHGAGRLVWSPLPLELSDSLLPVAELCRFGLNLAGVSPGFRISPDDPSLLVLPTIFQKAALYTIVSETDRDSPITLTHLETKTRVFLTVPAERTALVLIDRSTGKLIDSTVPTR